MILLIDQDRRTKQSFPDASYWIYLIYLPLALWAPGFLAGLQWHAAVKALLVLSSVTLVCVITYNYFVRSCYIGKTLNGRRYSRGLLLASEI